MNILAIESSCDETAAAVVKDGRFVLSSRVNSQIDIHALYGGVVPEIASRVHTESISVLVKEALSDAGITMNDIDAVAVTQCPGLIGALLVGVNFAKGLAYSNNLPLIPVHHIRGHIAANYTHYNGVSDEKILEPPFTALVISGGHTSLINANSYTDFEILGATRDDAAGEAFDKVARLLGLTYPGGAKMDALAKSSNPDAIHFPVANVKDFEYDFSFSGMKTAAINHIHTLEQKNETLNKEDIAASFTKAVVKSLTSRLEMLFSNGNTKKLVLAGGVSANSHIRSAVCDLCKKYNVTPYLPPLSLCSDNAIMIGAQAYYEYTSNKKIADLSLNAYATMGIDEV